MKTLTLSLTLTIPQYEALIKLFAALPDMNAELRGAYDALGEAFMKDIVAVNDPELYKLCRGDKSRVGKIHNPVTGAYYTVHEPERKNKGKPPVHGWWN